MPKSKKRTVTKRNRSRRQRTIGSPNAALGSPPTLPSGFSRGTAHHTNPLITTTITGNSEGAITPGSFIHYLMRSFPVAGEGPTPKVVLNWGTFEGAVLAIAFPDETGQNNVVGSAVIVAPGIALGSMHVYQHKVDELPGSGAYCFGLDGERADLWKIIGVTHAANGLSDLALFSLELHSALPDDLVFTHPVMTTRTPALGEVLTCVGFREGAPPNVGEDIKIRIGMDLFVFAGAVTQHYPDGRDKFGLPGPCVEVGCDTLGGMSGGPVFDPDGRLVGVLSRGLAGGPSWVSLLWPALGLTFKGGWPAKFMPGRQRLLDLTTEVVTIHGRTALSLDGKGSLRCAHWS